MQKSLNFGNIKKIASISLLLIIALTSIGLKVNTHVCQGDLKSIGVFVAAESCSNMSGASCTNASHEEGYNRKPCCTDLSYVAPNSEYESVQYTVTDIGSLNDFVPFKEVTGNEYPTLTHAFVLYKDDPPDIGSIDVQTMFQVYLI